MFQERLELTDILSPNLKQQLNLDKQRPKEFPWFVVKTCAQQNYPSFRGYISVVVAYTIGSTRIHESIAPIPNAYLVSLDQSPWHGLHPRHRGRGFTYPGNDVDRCGFSHWPRANSLPHCSFLAMPSSNVVEPTPRLLQLGRGGRLFFQHDLLLEEVAEAFGFGCNPFANRGGG